MLKYKRKSGSIIELKDTPEIKAFAEKQGWEQVKKKPKKAASDGNSADSNTRRS